MVQCGSCEWRNKCPQFTFDDAVKGALQTSSESQSCKVQLSIPQTSEFI